MKAVIPLEVGLPTLRSELCDQGLNDLNVARELDLAEERREAAAIRLAAYQQQLARGYNPKVKERRFAIGELVLKKTLPSDRDPNEGKLAPNWQGPFRITSTAGRSAYRLEDMEGKPLPRCISKNSTSEKMYSRNQISIKGNFSGKSLCIASRFAAVQPLFSGYQLSARRHRQLRHTYQGPVTVPPSRLGTSVQRANRPELGAFTSSGGTARSISGSGNSTTLAARRLCSEGQPS
ncbi:hypothetical protein AAC387_Pa07g3691 [Persea americana]